MLKQDEIIEMARQAGWTGIYSQWVSPTERQHLTVPVTIEQIEAFAKLVAAAAASKEREACLRIEDEVAYSPAMFATMQQYNAYAEAVSAYSAAIQARGEPTSRGTET